LQTLAYLGYIQINHQKIKQDMETWSILGGGGGTNKDSAQDRAFKIQKLFHILQYQLPAGCGFGAGFVGGMRSG
jgi:hypothetical protein